MQLNRIRTGSPGDLPERIEIAVKEGGAHSIMTTYGAINGLWTAGNYDLLQDCSVRSGDMTVW